MLAEMLDRRVRSESDLSESLQLPVLGNISWTAPARVRKGPFKLFAPRKAAPQLG